MSPPLPAPPPCNFSEYSSVLETPPAPSLLWDSETLVESQTLLCSCRDDGEMKNYHHPACIFETFKKARPSTKVKKKLLFSLFFFTQVAPRSSKTRPTWKDGARWPLKVGKLFSPSSTKFNRLMAWAHWKWKCNIVSIQYSGKLTKPGRFGSSGLLG